MQFLKYQRPPFSFSINIKLNIIYELNLTKTTLFREMLKMVTIWTKALQIIKVMKLHPPFEWLNMSENCYWSCVNSSFSICCWLICKRCRLDMWTIVPLCLQQTSYLSGTIYITHIRGGGGNCCVSVHVHILPFSDLEMHCFCALVKPHVEVAVQLIRSLHLCAVLFSSCLFLLFGGVISFYRVTRFPKVTLGPCCSPFDFFTSWT